MSSLIYNLFELVLASTAHFALACIEKWLWFPKITLEEDFKFLPHYHHEGIVTDLLFMLLPVIQGLVHQESSGKKDSFLAFGSGGGKMIFALLKKL